ncbi:MAG: response regulator [Sedimentisphaerales bacterium]|nr:response regulator [Sedimentisphaerales bacterium]
MFGLFKSGKKTGKVKILLVDDEPDFVSTIKHHLEWANYEVVVANNGQEGLEKAASDKPDLILLDTNMPVMNGHDMLESLSKDPQMKNLPVIMVTAACEVDDIATASSFGIVDYIAKPFDFAELKEKIASSLEGKKHLSGV